MVTAPEVEPEQPCYDRTTSGAAAAAAGEATVTAVPARAAPDVNAWKIGAFLSPAGTVAGWRAVGVE
jgi:hypothetical protein